MKATRTLQILFFTAVAVSASIFLSCNKEEPTIATVLVIDAAGDPVSGATVRLYGSPSETPPPPNTIALDTTVTTDATGKVSVDYSEFYKMGQAGFAVLDVEAYKGALYGVGIIKVAEQEETEVTIELN
ncbi:MAG: hypothetical protein ACKO8Q_06445 [Bacteroidota bacterium]|jgi:hypothetical protein